MKKALIGLIVLGLLLGAGFVWLLSGTSPDNAPSEEITVNVPTRFVE